MVHNHQQDTTSLGEQAGTAYKKASDMGKEFVDNATEQASRTREDLKTASNELSSKGIEAAENAQAVVGNFKTAVEKSTKDHPLTTLAMAAAMGFLLGAMWK